MRGVLATITNYAQCVVQMCYVPSPPLPLSLSLSLLLTYAHTCTLPHCYTCTVHTHTHQPQTTLGGFQEEATEALNNKNPNVKAEVLLFLCRCFQQCTPAMIPKPLLKAEVPLIVQVIFPFVIVILTSRYFPDVHCKPKIILCKLSNDTYMYCCQCFLDRLSKAYKSELARNACMAIMKTKDLCYTTTLLA